MALERILGAGPGLTAQIRANLGPIIKRVGAPEGQIADAAEKSLRESLTEIVDDLQKNRLSGSPAPVSSRGPIPRGGHYLAVRTGRGRGSMRSLVERANDRIVGSFGTLRGLAGDPDVYMAAHEQGFTGTVQVRGHSRQGRPVRPHQRFMDMPARRFIRAALLEGRPKFHAHLLETLEALFGRTAQA